MEIDFEKMEHHVLELMDLCHAHLNYILKGFADKEIVISHKFSLDTSVNAGSSLQDGCYSISLNNGAYVAVQKFYQEKFLYGDKGYYFSISKDSEFIEDKAKFYVQLMMDITLMTFMFHEYGHIYNGHLDYIAHEKINSNVQTMCVTLNSDEISEQTLSVRRHQALEWNADDFSATRIIEIIFQNSNFKKRYNDVFSLSIQEVFWIVANATLVSYSLLGSNKNPDNLECAIHLPAKFRALAYICTAEKKFKKFCDEKESMKPILEEAIALTGKEMEMYSLGYSKILSQKELQYYNLVEYELLVKLPVALSKYQYLMVISPQQSIKIMLALYEIMSLEEKKQFEEMVLKAG